MLTQVKKMDARLLDYKSFKALMSSQYPNRAPKGCFLAGLVWSQLRRTPHFIADNLTRKRTHSKCSPLYALPAHCAVLLTH